MDFEGDLIVSVLDTNGLSQTYATNININSLQGRWNAGVPLTSVRRSFSKDSGKLSQLEIRIELNGMNATEVRNLQLLAPISYQLKQLLKIDMTGMIHLSIDTPNGAAKVIADGELVFSQDGPVVFDQTKRSIYKANPLELSSVEKSSLS